MSHANAEMPTFLASSYSTNTMAAGDLHHFGGTGGGYVGFDDAAANKQENRRVQLMGGLANAHLHPQIKQEKELVMAVQATRRIVQVFMVDPNENVPLADCLLYKGEPHMTDLTDQELFYELDIKDILAKHNEKRVKLVNKLVKDRTEYLEPARVRDLRMTVVLIAGF